MATNNTPIIGNIAYIPHQARLTIVRSTPDIRSLPTNTFVLAANETQPKKFRLPARMVGREVYSHSIWCLDLEKYSNNRHLVDCFILVGNVIPEIQLYNHRTRNIPIPGLIGLLPRPGVLRFVVAANHMYEEDDDFVLDPTGASKKVVCLPHALIGNIALPSTLELVEEESDGSDGTCLCYIKIEDY